MGAFYPSIYNYLVKLMVIAFVMKFLFQLLQASEATVLLALLSDRSHLY